MALPMRTFRARGCSNPGASFSIAAGGQEANYAGRVAKTMTGFSDCAPSGPAIERPASRSQVPIRIAAPGW
jgi:hypothetical protein